MGAMEKQASHRMYPEREFVMIIIIIIILLYNMIRDGEYCIVQVVRAA